MRSRLIMLFVMLVCLPLQGLVAVTMSSCQMHDAKMEMNMDVSHSDDMSHCNHHNAHQPTNKTPCDKCLTCHLSIAQAIIPFNTPLELNGVAPMFTGQTAEIPDSALSSLFHPPRLIFA